MLKKLLAMLGKGSAKVDLMLEQESFALGEELTGKIHVHGGAVKQTINKIVVHLHVNVKNDGSMYTKSVCRFEVAESFKIHPEEERTFPLRLRLPKSLLLSASAVTYHVVTRLDIKYGRDYSDRDVVNIQPPKRLQNIFDAWKKLGFIETTDSRSFDGYLQEFEFSPTSLFHHQLEEIEFNAIIKEDGILLLLELDLHSFLGEEEISRECWIENSIIDHMEELVRYLREFIRETIQHSSRFVGEKKHLQKNYYQLPGAIGAVAIGWIVSEEIEEGVEKIGDQLEETLEDDEDEEDSFFAEHKD